MIKEFIEKIDPGMMYAYIDLNVKRIEGFWGQCMTKRYFPHIYFEASIPRTRDSVLRAVQKIMRRVKQ